MEGATSCVCDIPVWKPHLEEPFSFDHDIKLISGLDIIALQEEDRVRPILGVDVIDGKRVQSSAYPAPNRPGPLVRRMTTEGKLLVSRTEESDSLEDELEELKEDDYPDLIGADEEGEIIDEFALLAEEDVVFSAAKHEQDISESPSAMFIEDSSPLVYLL